MEQVEEKHHLRGLVVDQLDENTVMVLMKDKDMPLGFDFVSVKTNGRKLEIGQEISFYKQITTKTVIRWERVIGTAAIVLIILYFCLR